MAKARDLPALQHLPPGVRQVTTGDAEFMKQLFVGFFAAMAIGILCIYAVLVLLFHEFMQPLTILSALPPSIGSWCVNAVEIRTVAAGLRNRLRCVDRRPPAFTASFTSTDEE